MLWSFVSTLYSSDGTPFLYFSRDDYVAPQALRVDSSGERRGFVIIQGVSEVHADFLGLKIFRLN